MVPISVDLYGLRKSIQSENLHRLEAIDVTTRPLDSGWLLYGLSVLGSDEGALFEGTLDNLEKWVLRTAGSRDKDLSPLCICQMLSTKNEVKKTAEQKAQDILSRAFKTRGRKFNILNDPEQVYCASLVKDKLASDTKDALLSISKENATGRTSRKALYYAAIAGLGGNISELGALQIGQDAEDIISLLWLWKCYLKRDVAVFWDRLESLLPLVQLGSGPEECYLSNRSLALLGEAVSNEIKEPDPNMIFDLYPFAPEIKNLISSDFKQGNNLSAVFEAAKKLNEFIQQKTRDSRAEVDLVQATMKFRGDKLPIIQFNECLDETSGKNEQSGIALIAEGIFKAFRNPKGHKPADHHLVQMTPYECLSQLVTIDYIWRRVASAKIVSKNNK